MTINNGHDPYLLLCGDKKEHIGYTVDWLKLLLNYINLRSKNAVDERFFFRQERKRCVNQVVEKYTISKVPRELAVVLKLNNIDENTRHAFRRTSATFLANIHNADLLDLKHHGQWKSPTIAKEHI
ncbi:hypothetical protein BDFB_008765 [Asbolus verrucosus]|uniref:Tyr recombinase domain-containing protein n=1 Tax=Asbolus verrucosus TaxID=1661398 RepID=A0A482WCR8_ASBVE|nr:hypothetical protein BDFB_008765 [Asbolus verrucosus]